MKAKSIESEENAFMLVTLWGDGGLLSGQLKYSVQVHEQGTGTGYWLQCTGTSIKVIKKLKLKLKDFNLLSWRSPAYLGLSVMLVT